MSINTEADPGAPRPDLRKYFGPRLKAIVTKLLSLLAAKRTPPYPDGWGGGAACRLTQFDAPASCRISTPSHANWRAAGTHRSELE